MQPRARALARRSSACCTMRSLALSSALVACAPACLEYIGRAPPMYPTLYAVMQAHGAQRCRKLDRYRGRASSSRSTSGFLRMARAMAMRCFWGTSEAPRQHPEARHVRQRGATSPAPGRRSSGCPAAQHMHDFNTSRSVWLPMSKSAACLGARLFSHERVIPATHAESG